MFAIVGNIRVHFHVSTQIRCVNLDTADLALRFAHLLFLVSPDEFRALGAKIAARSPAQPQILDTVLLLVMLGHLTLAASPVGLVGDGREGKVATVALQPLDLGELEDVVGHISVDVGSDLARCWVPALYHVLVELGQRRELKIATYALE